MTSPDVSLESLREEEKEHEISRAGNKFEFLFLATSHLIKKHKQFAIRHCVCANLLDVTNQTTGQPPCLGNQG